MIDFIGIGVVLLFGLILIAIGNSMPDQTDIILQNRDKIIDLEKKLWECGDVQCQKNQNTAIKSTNAILDGVQLDQNMRNAFLGVGILVDIGTVIGLFLRLR